MAATIAQLRILLDDPAGASQVFDDTYYQLAVDTEDNLFYAGAMMARMFASHYAAKVDITAGPVKIANDQKFQHYKELADKLDNRAKGGGGAGAIGTGIVLTGVSVTEVDSVNADEDRIQGAFSIGMHDNPSPAEDETNESCF